MSLDLLTNVANRHEFIATQLASGRDRGEILAGQFSSLKASIATTPLTVSDAVAVGRLINEGPWTSEQRIDMQRLLGDVVSESGPREREATRGQQSCTTIEHYFTSRVWDVCGNRDGDLQDVADALGDGLYSLGMVCPDAKLLKRVASIMQMTFMGGAPLSVKSKINLSDLARDRVKLRDGMCRYPHKHMLHYPAKPDLLSKAHWDHAYGTDGPPVQMKDSDVASLIGFVSGMVRRKSANPTKLRPHTSHDSSLPVHTPPPSSLPVQTGLPLQLSMHGGMSDALALPGGMQMGSFQQMFQSALQQAVVHALGGSHATGSQQPPLRDRPQTGSLTPSPSASPQREPSPDAARHEQRPPQKTVGQSQLQNQVSPRSPVGHKPPVFRDTPVILDTPTDGTPAANATSDKLSTYISKMTHVSQTARGRKALAAIRKRPAGVDDEEADADDSDATVPESPVPPMKKPAASPPPAPKKHAAAAAPAKTKKISSTSSSKRRS